MGEVSMGDVSLREVVKEYVADVFGVEGTVKARITKETGSNGVIYMWEISHHWGKTHPYHPSSVSDADLETVEAYLKAYVAGFPGGLIVRNESY
jgi:hypothetical protein